MTGDSTPEWQTRLTAAMAEFRARKLRARMRREALQAARAVGLTRRRRATKPNTDEPKGGRHT